MIDTRWILTGLVGIALGAGTGCVHVEVVSTTTPELVEMDPEESLAQMPMDGRVIVAGQPSEEEFRAFASSGGTAVINLRTQREMGERVEFDQAELMDELGLEYVWMPMSGSQLNLALVQEFGERFDGIDDRSVMLHCASGGRASGMWASHLAVNDGIAEEVAVSRAEAVGLSGGMKAIAERIMLEVPDRVVLGVDPARLRVLVDTLAGFGTRHTLSETESKTRGIGAARRWVRAAFEEAVADSGRTGDLAVNIYLDWHQVESDGRRITRDVEIANVVCEIPGADKGSRGRLYYVLAHLDSRATDANDSSSDAPGANDDGSGVAALIELARVLAAERLDSTIVLMATSGEEQGLYGARLHANAALEQNADIRAVLNNDTIGSGRGVGEREALDTVRVFSEGLPLELLAQEPDRIASYVRRTRGIGSESDGPSRQLARYIHDIGHLHRTAVRPKLVFRPDRFLRGGDHTPFNELGFAAVRFCEVHEVYERQHQDVRVEDGVRFGDLPEFVDEVYLAGVTALNGAVLTHLANAPSAPGNARIIVATLTTDTTLRWEPSPEDDTAGYEIVWRDSTSPVWEDSLDVGNAIEGTVDLSKDNWVFGVRAYDREGYRSPVSFPMPARE